MEHEKTELTALAGATGAIGKSIAAAFRADKIYAPADGPLRPVYEELVEMNYLMTNPLIVDDSALQNLLGGIAKTPYSEGVRQPLAGSKAAI